MWVASAFTAVMYGSTGSHSVFRPDVVLILHKKPGCT